MRRMSEAFRAFEFHFRETAFPQSGQTYGYSDNASLGLTFVALTAGSQQATNATATNSIAPTRNVAGSAGATPNRSILRIRANAIPRQVPASKPVALRFIPSANINLIT